LNVEEVMDTTRANSKLPEVYVTRRQTLVRVVANRDNEAARQLLRDDVFDRIRSEEELERLLSRFAESSSAPHAEVVRRMVGMDLSEGEARGLYRRILEHRRELSRSLGRPVHVRVAALDLLTMTPDRGTKRPDSRPIVVTPSLLEKALEEAGADGVTGLPQRAHFMGLLRHELRQRRRRGLVVAYIDLDGFKRVNDEHGHASGDEVLRTIARIGRIVLRHGDVLARIGGDEFALLLVDVSEAEAGAIVARFRERFEEAVAPLAVSFSAGLSPSHEGDTAEEVLGRADAAMYGDKRARAPR
jgi:diguanylate cyclase (GGDEF)-like protein